MRWRLSRISLRVPGWSMLASVTVPRRRQSISMVGTLRDEPDPGGVLADLASRIEEERECIPLSCSGTNRGGL
jgi:hypothetical protein